MTSNIEERSVSDDTIADTTTDVFEGSLFASVAEQDFKGCRITPDNRISVYDAFGVITGKTPKQVRKLFDNIRGNPKNGAASEWSVIINLMEKGRLKLL